MSLIKTYEELNKKQKVEARERFKAPYTGYLYKLTRSGRINYRQKKRFQ